MRWTRLFLSALLLAAPLGVGAQPPGRPVDAETQRRLDWTVQRGRLLFALDRVAWVTTDDMRERVARDQATDIRGYVVDRDRAALTATYFAEENGRPVALYRARVENGRITSRQVFARGSRPALTVREQRLAGVVAQLRAAALPLAMCAPGAANIAVIPPETNDGPIDVYVTTPQTDRAAIPLGGHHRITFGPDGRIVARRAFTNACVSVPLAGPRPDARPLALNVNHLLDPVPTEIHVFSALAARLPVVVTAGGRQWLVTGESIRDMGDRPASRHGRAS